MSLTIKNLFKKYGTNTILNCINLKLNQGEIISAIGPSGSGKTTLLKCISGLCKIDEGEISINSIQIQELPPNKRNIGYVFQESPLLPHLNILENIIFNMKSFDNEKLYFLLEKVQIKNLTKRYPHEISGGENQRTAVVRSLIRNPDIFLLDEPFSNLDKITKEHTKELVFDVIKKTNTTTIMVNHDVQDSLELSDRILVMDNGNIQLSNPYKFYSEPKNLRIAKLSGEVNYLKIKDEDIYFRPHDVSIVEQSELQAEVIKTQFIGPFYKVIVKTAEQIITIYHKNKIEKKNKIYLDVKRRLNFNLTKS